MPSRLTSRTLHIIEVLKNLGIIQKDIEFYSAIGVNRSTASSIRNGGRDVPKTKIAAIADKFGVSLDYLLKGQGEMFTDEFSQKVLEKQDQDIAQTKEMLISHERRIKSVSFYDVVGTMTFTENWPDQVTKPFLVTEIPGYEGCDAIQSFGESMAPTYHSGCWVLGKRIHDRDLILYGECYIIVTRDHILIKRLLKDNDPKYIILYSDAYDPDNEEKRKFAPVRLSMAKVLNLWIIKGAIKRYQI